MPLLCLLRSLSSACCKRADCSPDVFDSPCIASLSIATTHAHCIPCEYLLQLAVVCYFARLDGCLLWDSLLIHRGACAENGVPVIVWLKGDSTKGAVRLSHDRKSVIVFDWKFPLVRKKKKFGPCSVSPSLVPAISKCGRSLSLMAVVFVLVFEPSIVLGFRSMCVFVCVFGCL